MKEEIKTILSEVVEKLKSKYKPLKVILFGPSRGYYFLFKRRDRRMLETTEEIINKLKEGIGGSSESTC
jgi:hypothetical protein